MGELISPEEVDSTVDPRLTKLPRWAQQRIEVAERNAAYWQSIAEAGPEVSDTFVHSYTDDGRDGGKPLGSGAEIRFDLPNGGSVFAQIVRGSLQLLGRGNRGTGIHVLPQSSNLVSIEVPQR